ncbi:MAG: class I SAM-dependent methyltransferase, partial [Syntrophomonadaceae bacterium]|nr:class I SAM-dependent methyltransferase [Syntrophomonadaceae bacterium]
SEHQAQGVVVWQVDGPIMHIANEVFFFHPSMAKNRIACFRKFRQIDNLARACQLQPHDSFLDCTLGLGADAIVASYFSKGGQIVALESSLLIAMIVKWGMKMYNSSMTWLNSAVKNIEVINANHYDYLKKLPDNSFDIVYFDPMFRKPILESQAIAPLRLMANHQELSKSSITEAIRVARKRVVVKEMTNSQEFERLGLVKLEYSPHNKLAYGIKEVD